MTSVSSSTRRTAAISSPWQRDGTFSTHQGVVPHTDLIGCVEGSRFETPGGGKFTIVRPGLTDYILKMKRGAEVVYPKDIGPILMYGDIGPGNTVVEAGTGSGALTMALVRAVGPTGRVVSVEKRSDHAQHATKALTRWFGSIPETLELRNGDVEDAIADVQPDRVVLDIPEPWHSAEIAATHLRSGGVFVAYVPTVPQMQQTVEMLRSTRSYLDITSFEVLIREWNVEGRSVRPDHQMVGHTGFITAARRVEPLSPSPEHVVG